MVAKLPWPQNRNNFALKLTAKIPACKEDTKTMRTVPIARNTAIS